MKISFFVPGSPLPKGRPRFGAAGRRPFTPARTEAYERLVGVHALVARQRLRESWPHAARYRVYLTFRGARANADLDNLCKAALDGCNLVLWHDDRQIDELHAGRSRDAGEPGLVMTVEVLPPRAGVAELEAKR